MNNYQNIRLEKAMYNSPRPFARQLEELDPSAAYQGTELAGLDAFERQLKRFDIKVSGPSSDSIEKFFSTADSAALFPEYVSRAVRQGMADSRVLERIVASRTSISSMDYRTLAAAGSGEELELKDVAEGGFIPQTTLRLKENLVRLKKRGRMLVASYEAIKFQRVDLFSVTLRQIGSAIAKSQLADAVQVLTQGDGNQNPAPVLTTAAAALAYGDLLALWNALEDFELNTILASPDMALSLLSLEEFKSSLTGADFQATGRLVTPLGAALLRTATLPAGTLIGLDRRYALEMVSAGEVTVDHDRLMDCQMERAAITSIAGFAKIFPEAAVVMKLKA